MKTIVAFANTSGGKLVIGVDDVTKDIVGVEFRKVENTCERGIFGE